MVARHFLVMGAVLRETAFEKDEVFHVEWIGNEAAPSLEEVRDLAGAAALPSREGDVRVVGAAFRFETDALADALYLGGERGQGFLGFYAGP